MKTNNPILKWAKDLNRHFSKKDIQMANKHMKRFRTSLIIRSVQTKTTMRCHFKPIRMTIIKIKNKKKTSNGEKLEPSCTVGRECDTEIWET